jgi:sigma-B regulation protein RsbU (phosphoserine phosphatase)
MGAVAMQEFQTETTRDRGRVLIADDQEHILDALQMLLNNYGFSTEAVTHPAGVLRALQSGPFDAVLMDLNYTRDTTGGGEGLDLLARIRSIDSLVPIVVMTAWSTVDLAVEAMRRGASDFVRKPWDNQDLLQKLGMQTSWARAQRRAQRLREEELQEAREIQASLLPKQLPELPGYEVAAMTQPLQFVGGDYYTVVRISERHVAFCIADVSGKGMPAALLMSNLQAAVKPLMWQQLTPREVCQRLNRALCDLAPIGKFVSLFYAVLDTAEGRVTYCNAGHNPPLLIRRDGRSEEFDAAGAVLGQFPQWTYEQSEVQLDTGDQVLMFTDGLVEASNANDEWFGEQGLVRIARENPDTSAEELMRLLIGAASKHCEGQFRDDASLMVLRAARPRKGH